MALGRDTKLVWFQMFILKKLVWTIFFFSSRRRHTLFSRDWSSDVCSSDLEINAYLETKVQPVEAMFDYLYEELPAELAAQREQRSEERRVGKECRSQGDPFPCEKEGYC